MRIRMTEGLHVETVNDEILVASSGSDTVVRLSGESAEIVRSCIDNGETDVPEGDVLDGLLAHGVVEPFDEASAGLSRRQLIGTAAAFTGIGIAAMAMPTAAAAASPGPTPPPPTDLPFTNPSVFVEQGTNVFFIVWNSGATDTPANTAVSYNWSITASSVNPIGGLSPTSGSSSGTSPNIAVTGWNAGTLTLSITATGPGAGWTKTFPRSATWSPL